jgi:hypothetical protein
MEGQEERICDILGNFNEKKDIIDGMSKSSLFNVSVKDLLEDSSSLLYRISLYRKDYQAACSIIDSTYDLIKNVKLTLSSRCTDMIVLKGIAEKAARSRDDLTFRDCLFIVRALLLLISEPCMTEILEMLYLLTNNTTDYSTEPSSCEEEIIWIIVFMHNTALDLCKSCDYADAKVWSEWALRLCSLLTGDQQTNYEKVVRSAFLSIIQAR